MQWIEHPRSCDHGFVAFVAAALRPDEAPVVVRSELLEVIWGKGPPFGKAAGLLQPVSCPGV